MSICCLERLIENKRETSRGPSFCKRQQMVKELANNSWQNKLPLISIQYYIRQKPLYSPKTSTVIGLKQRLLNIQFIEIITIEMCIMMCLTLWKSACNTQINGTMMLFRFIWKHCKLIFTLKGKIVFWHADVLLILLFTEMSACCGFDLWSLF